MAPEVLSSQVGPASDVWSAGVMAFQLLTGRFPFDDRKNPLRPSVTKIWCAPVSPMSSPETPVACDALPDHARRMHTQYNLTVNSWM